MISGIDIAPVFLVSSCVAMMVVCWVMVYINHRIRRAYLKNLRLAEERHKKALAEADRLLKESEAAYRLLSRSNNQLADQFVKVNAVIDGLRDRQIPSIAPRETDDLRFMYPIKDPGSVRGVARLDPHPAPGELHSGEMREYMLRCSVFVPPVEDGRKISVVRASLIAFGAILFADAVESEFQRSIREGRDARL